MYFQKTMLTLLKSWLKNPFSH